MQSSKKATNGKHTNESRKTTKVRRKQGVKAGPLAVRARRTPNPYQPWDAVIVGIDPSSSAHGYCTMSSGNYIDSGWFYGDKAIESVVRLAVRRADLFDLPVVFVIEDWYGNIKPLKKLCEERGKWMYVIGVISSMKAQKLIELINVSTWSSAYGLPKSTNARKGQSIAIANEITKNYARDVVRDDEADAILIANFASKWSGLSKLGLKKIRS